VTGTALVVRKELHFNSWLARQLSARVCAVALRMPGHAGTHRCRKMAARR